jgi:hypothetical protein
MKRRKSEKLRFSLERKSPQRGGGWEKRRKGKAKLFTFLGNPPKRGMGKKKDKMGKVKSFAFPFLLFILSFSSFLPSFFPSLF